MRLPHTLRRRRARAVASPPARSAQHHASAPRAPPPRYSSPHSPPRAPRPAPTRPFSNRPKPLHPAPGLPLAAAECKLSLTFQPPGVTNVPYAWTAAGQEALKNKKPWELASVSV